MEVETREDVRHIDASASETTFDSAEHRQSLIENINQLRTDSGYTDMTIKIESKLYPCHKVCIFDLCVLMVQSLQFVCRHHLSGLILLFCCLLSIS